jgi:predicted molibdopterin-dependent oxidoreductase YjgC
MPWHYPGYQPVDSEDAARIFEQGWNIEPGGLNRKRGLTTTEILSAVAPGGVRALFIMGENPMMSEPNLNHTHHQMEGLEFLVAQDLFVNESSAFAVRLEARLGRPNSAYWRYQHPSEVLEEMGRLVPDYAGVTYARLENEGLQTPVWDDQHPGTPVLFTESFPRGRGKFHPLDYHPAVESTDADYPFILTTGRVLEHWHGGSMTRNSKLDDLYPEAQMELHPEDARRLGVTDRQALRVTSRRGSIALRACVTHKTTPGVVFIPFHFAEAAANLLTIDALDPLAKIPEYKACAVRVVAAEDSELFNPEAQQLRGRY